MIPAEVLAGEPLDIGFELDISPSIGADLPAGQDTKALDDSAISGTLVLASDIISPAVPIELRFGTKYDTEFDDDAPTSAAFAKITVGAKDYPLSRYLNAEHAKVSDGQRLYASFGIIRRYDEYLADYTRTDKTVTIGTRYRNVRTIMGMRTDATGSPCSAQACGAASDIKGVYYQIKGEASRTWSTDRLKDRLSPKGVFEIYGPRWGQGVRLYGAADVTVELYDEASKGSLVDREDTIAGAAIGIDLSELAKDRLRAFDDVALSVSVRFEKGWSNAASERYERVFILPSITLTF